MDLALRHMTNMPPMNLSRVAIFANFPRDCLKELVAKVTRKVVRPGEVVWAQELPSNS